MKKTIKILTAISITLTVICVGVVALSIQNQIETSTYINSEYGISFDFPTQLQTEEYDNILTHNEGVTILLRSSETNSTYTEFSIEPIKTDETNHDDAIVDEIQRLSTIKICDASAKNGTVEDSIGKKTMITRFRDNGYTYAVTTHIPVGSLSSIYQNTHNLLIKSLSCTAPKDLPIDTTSWLKEKSDKYSFLYPESTELKKSIATITGTSITKYEILSKGKDNHTLEIIIEPTKESFIFEKNRLETKRFQLCGQDAKQEVFEGQIHTFSNRPLLIQLTSPFSAKKEHMAILSTLVCY